MKVSIVERREDGHDYVEVLNESNQRLFCAKSREQAEKILSEDARILATQLWSDPAKIWPYLNK